MSEDGAEFVISLNDTKVSGIKRSAMVEYFDTTNPSGRINIYHHNNVEYTDLTIINGFDGEAIASHVEAGNLRLGSMLKYSKSGDIS